MQLVKKELSDGRKLEDLFIVGNDEWDFVGFTAKWADNCLFERRPKWDRIFEVGRLPSPVKKKEAKGPVSMFAANFSNSEFARLVVLLASDEAVRKALQDSVLEMTRGELDAGVNRDAFWSNLVAQKFNDSGYRPVYSFEGVVEGVDTAAAPMAERGGPFLKTQYQAGRKLFSVAFKRWSESGQNDPDAFYRFTGLRRDQTVSSDGEKAIIIFTVLKCGTSERDASFIDVLYRGIGGVAPCGFENGPGVQKLERRRVRRKSSTSQNSDDVESVRQIIDFAKSQLSGTVLPAAPENGPAQEAARKVKMVETEVHTWEQKQKLLKLLTEAREMMSQESDPDVHDAWKVQFQGILRKIKEVDSKRSSGGAGPNASSS